MATNENLIPIPGRLHSVATEGHVAGADEIYDDNLSKDQQTINAEVNAALGEGGTVDKKIADAIDGALEDVAFIDDSESSPAVVPGFDPTTDTVHVTAQTLSEQQKAQVRNNIGLGDVDARISNAVASEASQRAAAVSGVQSSVNAETSRARAAEADRYTKSETYTKTEVNGLVDTPHQEYVTVDAYANLPATGSKDTIYRVSNYNGSTSQVDASVYSEYAWDGTKYVFLCVKSQIGEVFDISVYNNNAKYADLAAALNGGANIPQSLQKGGMSVKFVRSSDNKYVQYRLMLSEFTAAQFTNTANWQGVDDEPTAGSNNLVMSNGTYRQINAINEQINGVDYELSDISGFPLQYGVIGSDGKWKNFNSSYQHIVIPVDYVGSKLSIKISNSSPNTLKYAYLKSYNNPQSGDSADYCSGTTLKTVNIGSSKTKESVPNDCNYIILETVFNGQTILIETFKLEYSEEGELPTIRALIQVVNDKIDHITPEFYGAIADGTTDCTQAIQDCLDTNHACHLGVGTYLITDTIIIPEESVIKGEGRNTIIKYGGAEDENTYMFKTLSTSFKSQISDLCLNGNELCSGIYDGENSEMASATRLVVQNVMINDCIIGITLNSNGSEFSNIYIKGSQLVSKIGFNILKGDNIISDCRAFQHSEYGFKINSGGTNIVNCKAALNDVGFYISGNNSNILAYSQENFGDNIVLQNARRNIITFISDHAGSFYVDREPTEEGTYINYGKPKDGMGLGSILKIFTPCINNIITINSSVHGQILSTASFETSVLDLGEDSTTIGNTITIGYGVINSEFTPFDFEPIKGVSFNYGNSIIVNGTLPFNANSDILKVNNFIDITKQAISSVNSVFGNELEYDEQKSIISGTLSNPSATNIIDFALVYNNFKSYGDVVFVVNNVDKESDIKLASSLFRINTSAVESEKKVSIGYKNILDYFDMHNGAILNMNRCILKSSSANLSSNVNIEIKVFAKDKKMFEIENEESETKTVTGAVFLKKNHTYKVTCSPSDVNGGTITFRNINDEKIHTMNISGGQEKYLTMSDDIYEVRCFISGNTVINIM